MLSTASFVEETIPQAAVWQWKGKMIATVAHHLARLYEQKLAALGALKKSLLHQAFTGEL